MTPNALLVSDRAMIEHDPGPGHPERARRLEAILERLEGRAPANSSWGEAAVADRAAIERVHRGAYVDRVESLRGRSGALDPDTNVSPGSVDAAYVAAGCAIEAVRAVCAGDARRAFALVRPPGHHAEADRAMGFCLFNNIAIAAAHARSALGCDRIAVIDWDVHHGNGTQHVFEDRADILVANVHRSPFYPGSGAADETGRGAGEGCTVNVPLPPGFGDAEYLAVFDAIIVPVVEAFAPELVLVSAGFDAHERDPLGGMHVTTEGFAALCSIVCALADRVAGGRLVLVLEGGYDLGALAESVQACVNVLAGAPVPRTAAGPHRAGDVIKAVQSIQRRFWPVASA